MDSKFECPSEEYFTSVKTFFCAKPWEKLNKTLIDKQLSCAPLLFLQEVIANAAQITEENSYCDMIGSEYNRKYG